MEKTPSGTSVGVDDPYAFAGRCDYMTDDGRCRFAVEHATSDPAFARERRREDYACPIVEEGSSNPVGGANEGSSGEEREEGTRACWRECPHYRSRTHGRQCVRCGLEERRTTDAGERPLLDEHHLSYGESGSASSSPAPPGASHEITVSLCRWCHARVHGSWARLADDASPDPEAIAAREGRRSRERAETAFETAAKRRENAEE
jgi:hypothetical protein